MAQLFSLGHFARMNILPTSKSDWLSFVSFPFKAFVVASVVIYPVWLRSARPFKAGAIGSDYTIIDPDRLPVSFEVVVTAYFVASRFVRHCHYSVVGQNRRGSAWSGIFAVAALCLAVVGAVHPVYK